MTEAEIIPHDNANTATEPDLNAPCPITFSSSPKTPPSPPGSQFYASSASPIRLPSVNGFVFTENIRKGSNKFRVWEWLGDAFLGFCSAHFLACLHPNLDGKLVAQYLNEFRTASTHTKCAKNCFIGNDERSLYDPATQFPGVQSYKICSGWLEAYFGVALKSAGFQDNKLWESGKEITMVALNLIEERDPSKRGKNRRPVPCQVPGNYSNFIFSFLITETVWSFADKHHHVYLAKRCLTLMDEARKRLIHCYPNLQQSDSPPTNAEKEFEDGIVNRLNTEHDLSAVSKKLCRDLQRHPSVIEELEKLEDELCRWSVANMPYRQKCAHFISPQWTKGTGLQPFQQH
jgi:hypothetical protein